jgi:hypothetical protein
MSSFSHNCWDSQDEIALSNTNNYFSPIYLRFDVNKLFEDRLSYAASKIGYDHNSEERPKSSQSDNSNGACRGGSSSKRMKINEYYASINGYDDPELIELDMEK